MPHILVAGAMHEAGREVLDAAPGVTATFIDEITEESYAPHVAEADALVVRTQPVSAATIARAGRLKIVSRHGVGYDAVDVAALSARGIPLVVCGDVNASSVAEHAAMMILATHKMAVRADTAVRRGPWTWRNRLEARDVAGRRLLLIGYGRVGRHLARMMKGFGLEIRAYDPLLLPRGWPDGDVTPVATLEAGLGWAEIISVSAPHSGKPLIGAAEFAAMRDGAVLVNTARGGIVDETALAAALDSGKVGAAGLDVFAEEPLPTGHPLTAYDQVILSPHIAGVTAEAAERMAMDSVQNVLDFFDGRLERDRIINSDRIDVA